MTAPSASPTPLPPPLLAMLAQVRGLRGQLDALELSIEAFGHALQASAARAQNEAARQARDVNGARVMGPVFGAPAESVPSAPADVDRALAQLDGSPAPTPGV